MQENTRTKFDYSKLTRSFEQVDGFAVYETHVDI